MHLCTSGRDRIGLCGRGRQKRIGYYHGHRPHMVPTDVRLRSVATLDEVEDD